MGIPPSCFPSFLLSPFLRFSAVKILPLLCLVSIAFLAGCATAPPKVRVPGEAAAWIGAVPRVVVRLSTADVEAWGDVTGTRDALKTVGERARAVWLGFELDHLDDLAHAADTVRIVLEGDFPKGAAGFMLDWNPAWKKAGAGVWTNAQLGLSVSLPDDGLVTVRRGDPEPARAVSGVLRDLDPVEVERPAVWISFWDPGEALFGSVGAKLLPVARLDVVLENREGFLEGPLTLHFTDARAARAASVLLKLFAGPIRARLGQDLTWTVDDTRIVGTTLKFRQSDLRALAERLVADTDPKNPLEVTP